MKIDLEILQASIGIKYQIAKFFSVLADADESDLFLPYPLTAEQAGVVDKRPGAVFLSLWGSF